VTPAAIRALRLLPLLALAACGPSRTGVLVPHGEPELVVMDFARPFPLSPLPDGWYHRTFWTRRPMAVSFATKDGVPALRAETEGTASMLFRHVDVPLADYPVLTWRWYVERPLDSPLDERTRAGDDHPARLFLAFSAGKDEHRMEIVWGDRLHAGEWKYIEGFPHYVADGGDENAGRWRDERVDLRALYASLWPDSAPARLTDIAVFCDSDETGGHTVSYTAAVTMHREAP
jgi:hypothetical protein